MSTGSSEQRCGIPAHAFNAKTATTTAGDVLALDGTWYQWRRVFECELVFVRHGISHELLLPTLQLSQFLLSLCGERLVGYDMNIYLFGYEIFVNQWCSKCWWDNLRHCTDCLDRGWWMIDE